MTILIVEDNKIDLALLKLVLRDSGHEIVVAANGVEALAYIRRGTCRIVISDWEMPAMNGLQLCRAVRSEPIPGYVYLILLTSHDTPADRVEGLQAGADDLIAKPYLAAELLARIKTAERILSVETRDVAIFALARLAESRDPETGAHLERVRGYSRVLAQHLALMSAHADVIDAEFVRLIYLTSPLHDIGKVGIPDSVLLKPGRLSENEFETMKTHTTIGADTLDAALLQFPNVKFLQMARDIAASHHERFDGTGYPGRLRGTNIPLCARIVAVADVYDALTSKRVYKGALAHDVAKSMITQESGTHFDPDVVNAFLAKESEFLSIRQQHAESYSAAA